MAVLSRIPAPVLNLLSRKLVFAALAGAAALATQPALASVTVRVDNGAQRMSVLVDGAPAYNWPVSTARPGYRTPAGSYRVGRMERMWYSRKYDWSPMPHALFFRGGYAIHGTGSIRQLGRPASHGCVRLHPANARTLFSLVQAHGGARVVVTDGADRNTWARQSEKTARPSRAAYPRRYDEAYPAPESVDPLYAPVRGRVVVPVDMFFPVPVE